MNNVIKYYDQTLGMYVEKRTVDYALSKNAKQVFFGSMTFVTSHDEDYNELYDLYEIEEYMLKNSILIKNPTFAVVQSVAHVKNYSEDIIDEYCENKGYDYIIPEDYEGLILWNMNHQIK